MKRKIVKMSFNDNEIYFIQVKNTNLYSINFQMIKNPDMHARRGRRERFKMSRGREIDSMS